jgi:hypothetical protein
MTSLPASSQATTHPHRAFGLRISACLPLRELQTDESPGTPDVEIVFGEVPTELEGALEIGVRYQAAPGRLLLVVDDVARFLIEQGRKITIGLFPNADDDDVRLFLLGSAFGALLHQRQDLVLHASAIAVDGGGIAFMGISGAGKSTLAMAFRRRGYSVLTDDLCVIRPGADGRMVIHPGFPQAKLWLDSLKQLDVSPDDLTRIRKKLEKRALPLASTFANAPLPVRKIYLLRSTNKEEIKLTPAQGPQKFNILKNHTYRFLFVKGMEVKPGHFQQAVKVAQQAALSIVTRPRQIFKLEELVTMLEADFRA